MSLRVLPSSAGGSGSTTNGGSDNDAVISASRKDCAHPSYAVHDTLRHGFREIRHDLLPGHPIQANLDPRQWNATQRSLRMEMYSRIHGQHVPLRMNMERAILSQVQPRLPVLPVSRVALDVLEGRDEWLDFEDTLQDPQMYPREVNVHNATEVMRYGWKKAL